MTSEPQRLHPAAAFSEALGALRDLALPIIVGVVLGGRSMGVGSLLLGVGGAVAAGVLGVVRWRATSYRVAGRALHFRSGVLSPDETVVPIDRVQSVDTLAGPVQRLFGVTGLQVQTPGGGEHAEVALTALSTRQARELRAALGHPEMATSGPVERLGGRGLLVTALTAPQVTVLLPVLGLLGGALQEGIVGIDTGERLAGRLDSPGRVAAALAVVLAAAWLLSFAGTVVAFSGFEVSRSDGRLRIRRGLLQRRAVTVPVARVDGVELVAGPLRRPFGMAALRLEVAGLGPESASARTLFPLLRARDAEAFLRRLLPEIAVPLTPTVCPPRRTLRRYLTVPVAVALAAAAVLVVLLPVAWPAAPALVALAALLGADAHAAAGLRLEGDRVVLRHWRRGSRVTLAARVRRLQEHGVSRTPLQRRAGLATVGLAVGSGARAEVRHVELAVAGAFLDQLRPGRR